MAMIITFIIVEKKNIIRLILPLVILLIVSCNVRHGNLVSMALTFAEADKPDSAILILNGINRKELSNSDEAMYALAYTIAQDKSGIDVDNDSLIRIAYEWYRKKPADVLSAKSLYYMGKCYALNDCGDKAIVCFRMAAKIAKYNHDNDTQCLSLLQLSVIQRDYDASIAIANAKKAVAIYNNEKGAKAYNKAYYLLNLAESISYRNGDEMVRCISLVKDAICLAIKSKDSTAISDSYQDLASFYGMIELYDSALEASKISQKFSIKKEFAKDYSICQFYVLTDSLEQAKLYLKKVLPLNLNDSCLFYLIKRSIAIKEHDWNKVESLVDSTDNYFDKKNSENLRAKNKYYSLLFQKEMAKAKSDSENRLKSYAIIIIILVFSIIIALLYFIFLQKRKRMRIRMEDNERIRQIEAEHKERQIATMRKFLISKIDIIKRLQSIKSVGRKQIILTEADWGEIEMFLNSTNNGFVERLQSEFPLLTQKDIKFLMLVRLKLPYESIAIIYGIEEKSVKQRLFLFKSKLGLSKGKISTREFLEDY